MCILWWNSCWKSYQRSVIDGIKGFEKTFQKGDVVAARLVGKEEAFAFGVACISSQQLEDKTKKFSGAGVDVSHVLKDQLWEMMISNRKEDE